MNVLTFTSLWPSAERPGFGLFVKHRAAAIARLPGIRLRTVAPIPYFPRWIDSSLVPEAWRRMARVADREAVGGIETFHPRYLVTPKVGMRFYAHWMVRGAESLVQHLHAHCTIDVIDGHYVYPDGAAAVRLGAQLQVPVFLTARGTDINLFAQMPSIRPQIVRALQQATGVIAVSQALKDRIMDLGIDAAKIAVIRNGIDHSLFHPLNRHQARAQVGLDEQAKVIVSVAALVPLKRIELLIDAIGLIADRAVKLYVIGEGGERARLEARIAARGLAERVVLVGARPQHELACWYAAADLFCLASRREGCPNVMIEAMACGAPIVASDVGGIAELVAQPYCGRLITDPTAETFSVEITAALAQQWDRERIAACGSSRSWHVVGEEVIEFMRRQLRQA